MGHQIVLQPDGRLAVWSSIVDDWILFDADPAELVEHYAARAAEKAREDTERTVRLVLKGEARAAYFQFVRTFDEFQAERLRHHGAAPWPPEAADP